MKKIISFALVFMLGCNGNKTIPLQPEVPHQVVTKPIEVSTTPASAESTGAPLTRKKLGKTGYSILLSDAYTLSRLKDSLFSVQIKTAEVNGELKITFYDKGTFPEPKIPASAPHIESFIDTFCETPCEILYYPSFALSIVQGDILTDYRIRIQIVTKNINEAMRPELQERNRLYGILKSLQKD